MACGLEETLDISEEDTASVFVAEQPSKVAAVRFLNIDKYSPDYTASRLRRRQSSAYSHCYLHCDVQYYIQKRAINFVLCISPVRSSEN